MVLHGKLAVHGCLAVRDRSFGRSPQKFVAVHPKSPWPFTPGVGGRSPQKFVAVHLISQIGRSLKMGVLFRIGRSFSPFSLESIKVVHQEDKSVISDPVKLHWS